MHETAHLCFDPDENGKQVPDWVLQFDDWVRDKVQTGNVDDLTNYRERAPYARENIKLFSAVMAHYAADAHVPFHAALNYDGQLTGQWGIHSRFESELFERYQSTLQLSPRRPASIGNPREFIFETLTTSFPLVQPVLDADKAAVAGREFYDDVYFEQFFAKVKPILEKRLSDSIGDVAGMITAAWVEAGRPALPLEAPNAPKKVRRP